MKKERYRCKCCNKVRDPKIDKKSNKFCNYCYDEKILEEKEETKK